MSKFTKATKRITAVAASAVMASSAVLGAGLSSYPSNFVKNGVFDGQVVVGAAAAASDSVAANSIIDDLKAEFSGASEKVKITYKSATAGGESRDIARANEELNYGETLEASSENGGFDDQDLDMLADDKFKNGVSDTDYSQTLQLKNGVFNHALRDNVDGVTKISDNVYYPANTNFAQYVLTLDDTLTLSATQSTNDGNFVGKTLNIMGNDFTIAAITADGLQNLNKLVLVGGANKISLGEGETQTVTVAGQSYEVAVASVSSSKVLMSVNGETKSIDLYDTESLGGVNVAVTDLVSSSRDAVKGYAEIVVGGQKIELRDGTSVVKVNDENVDKVYTDYYITSDFGTGFSTITINYAVDDDTSLEMGDSLTDVLFGAFTVTMDGTNEPTYETIEVSSNNDDVRVKGNLINGDSFNRDLIHSTSVTAATSSVYLRGVQDDDRLLFGNSTFNDYTVTYATNAAGDGTHRVNISVNGGTAITVSNAPANGATPTTTAAAIVTAINAASGLTGYVNATSSAGVVTIKPTGAAYITVVEDTTDSTQTQVAATSAATTKVFDLTSTVTRGMSFLMEVDNNEQYLYEISTIDINDADHKVDFDEVLSGKNKGTVKRTAWDTDLGDTMTMAAETTWGTEVTLGQLGNTIAFANEALLELSASSEAVSLTASSGTVSLTFMLDSADTDQDNTGDDTKTVTVALGIDESNDEWDVKSVTLSGVVNSGLADIEDGNSDVQEFVDVYGTKVVYDNKDKTYAKIMTPNKQLAGKVTITAGTEAASTQTVTVDADMVDSKKAELEDAGYTIVGTESVATSAVEFGVSAPVMDSDVTGMSNMIVVGGPAVNKVAASLLGMSYPTYEAAAGVNAGEAVIRFYEASNSVLVYGYDAADTTAAAAKLNEGGLSGSLVNVQ